jgi:hypothetical protein
MSILYIYFKIWNENMLKNMLNDEKIQVEAINA